MAYIGVQPTDTYLSIASQQITGTGSATYTLNYSVSDEESLAVFVNNVRQNVSSYTVSGDQLTLGGTISASDECWVLFLGRTVGTKTPAVGSVTNDMLAGSITTSKISNLYPYRNLIINGDMSIAQRGTSFSGMTTGQYTIDRWKSSTSGANLTMAQQSFTGTDIDNFNSKNYIRFTVNTANNNCGFLQYVEDAKRFLGKTVTLSFKAKGTNPAGGIIETAIACYTGSGGSYTTENRQQYSVTSNWQTFSFTTTIQSASGLTINDADSYMYVYPVIQPTGDTSTTSWEVDVAEVQVEYGNVSSSFEVIPYDVNLQRCYRYYEKDTTEYRFSLQTNADFGAKVGHLQWKVTKRTTPSLTANPDAGSINLTRRTIWGCGLTLGGAVSTSSNLPNGYIADSEL